MEAARPGGLRRRARRGTVEKPLNTRLVRVATIVVAPALLALLFSISPTGTLPPPSLDPLFNGAEAALLATDLSTKHPSRVPGTAEAQAATVWYTDAIDRLGLPTEEDVWSADVPDLGVVELRNVVTVIPGRAEEAIIVVAHRDNAGVSQPLGDNASGTAALAELARGYAQQDLAPAPQPDRTLVLLSTDAGAYGGAGVRRFAEQSPYAEGAIAAVVLDGIGGRGRPRLALAGDDARSPSRVLVQTASARVEEHFGREPALPSLATQLVDLAIPFAAGEQGPLLGRGVATVTLTTDDPDDPGIPAGDPAAPLAVERFTRLGRATESLIGSVDASAGSVFPTHDSVFLEDRAASGWTFRLTLIVAVVPFALGALDLLVRARRRRLPLKPAVRALRTRLVLWLYAGLLVWLGAVAGIFPTGDSLPLPPYAELVADPPFAALGLLAIALALGWLVARRRIAPPYEPTPEERLAGYTTALAALALVAFVVAIVQPYALLFVLPSLYAWIWLPVRTRVWPRVAIFLAGLVGPALGLVVLANEVGLGPAEAALFVLGLVTVGYVSLTSAVLCLAWGAVAGQLAALAFGRYVPYARGAEPPAPGPVRIGLGRAMGYGRRR
jgi:Peptidase family M28